MNAKNLKNTLLTLIIVFFSFGVAAQDKWDLRRCVEFAVANNIQVRQADIQARLAGITTEQSKASRFPTLNFTNNEGLQFGRSIDPATNLFTNQQIKFSQFQLGSNVTLFNWFSQSNQIAGNILEQKASEANVERLKNDISLNVAAAYLQALLSRERVSISKVQLNNTLEQLSNTRKLVLAGSLPELNAAELEAQLSRDSSGLIEAETAYFTNLLQMKLVMNMDPALPLDLDAPPVERIPVEPIATLEPAYVYGMALKNLPQQRVNDLRTQSLQKQLKAARGQMYPTISAFGGMTTSYSSALKRLPSGASVPITIPIGFTGSGSATNPNVFAETFVPAGFEKATFARQLDYQLRQNVGLSLSIPVFNGYQARSGWERSKLNLRNQQLQNERDNLQLKQDIYNAYNSAVAALQRFVAAQKAVTTAEYSYTLSKKRYEAGLLRTIDLITNQNNLFRARIEVLLNQYDYVFRMKVLEFYKGEGLKL